MIDFTYNPIIPADYKSKRERTSLRSLSLPGSPFLTEENGLSWKHPVVSVRRAFSGAWMVRDGSFVVPDADRGIPVGVQCFKLAKLSLMPFGAEIIGG